jgi:hypothetical protein
MGSPAVVPASFNVQWDRETVTFGPLTAAVVIWQPQNSSIGIFARPRGMNLQIVFDPTTGRGTWTLSGVQGQAVGALRVERGQ